MSKTKRRFLRSLRSLRRISWHKVTVFCLLIIIWGCTLRLVWLAYDAWRA